MATEHEDKIDRIMSNAVKLAEQTVKDAQPGFINLIDALDKWLTKKLRD